VGVKFAAISGGDTAVIDDETAFLITDGGLALISYYGPTIYGDFTSEWGSGCGWR